MPLYFKSERKIQALLDFEMGRRISTPFIILKGNWKSRRPSILKRKEKSKCPSILKGIGKSKRRSVFKRERKVQAPLFFIRDRKVQAPIYFEGEKIQAPFYFKRDRKVQAPLFCKREKKIQGRESPSAPLFKMGTENQIARLSKKGNGNSMRPSILKKEIQMPSILEGNGKSKYLSI